MLKILTKDLKIISDKLILFVIAYLIVIIFFTTVDKNLLIGSIALLTFFPTFLLLTTVCLLVYYDEKNNFAELFYSLPNNKVDILYSKYIIAIGTVILGFFVSYLIDGFLNFAQSNALFSLDDKLGLERSLEFNYFELIFLLSVPIFTFPIYLKIKKTSLSVIIGMLVLILFGWASFYLIFKSQWFIIDQIISKDNKEMIEFMLKYYVHIMSALILLVSSYLSMKYSKYLIGRGV